MPQVLVLVQARVSVQLAPEEVSPPQGQDWEQPAVRELLRELSALWAQEKLGVWSQGASEERPAV